MTGQPKDPEPTNPNPPAPSSDDKKALKDLDIRSDEAAKVKGGARRLEDPCAGGE